MCYNHACLVYSAYCEHIHFYLNLSIACNINYMYVYHEYNCSNVSDKKYLDDQQFFVVIENTFNSNLIGHVS